MFGGFRRSGRDLRQWAEQRWWLPYVGFCSLLLVYHLVLALRSLLPCDISTVTVFHGYADLQGYVDRLPQVYPQMHETWFFSRLKLASLVSI